MKLLALLLTIMSLSTSCQTINNWFKGEEEEPQKEETQKAEEDTSALAEKNIYPLTNRELELRLAKLWARVDQMEKLVLRLKERGELLERGMMLGIVPEELKSNLYEESVSAHLKPNPMNPTETTPEPMQKTQEVSNESQKKTNPTSFRKDLAQAQQAFDAGEYGKAIVEYSDLGKQYGESLTQGNHLFWIGLSWFYLKEYELSQDFLNRFTNNYPSNPWLVKAKLYLAKIQINQGYKKVALKQLKNLIERHPDHQVTDMAKLELSKLQEKL